MAVEHARHDHLLVASLLDRDLPVEIRSRAEAQVASCVACAQLLTDLRAIAAATANLPVPARPKDFRLSAEDAARLRPRGLRRLLAGLASPRLAVLRPLGAALATLGLAGLLLTASPLGSTFTGPPGSSSERNALAPAARSGAGATAGPDLSPGLLGPASPGPGTERGGADGAGLSRPTPAPVLGGEPEVQVEGDGGGDLRASGSGPEVLVVPLFGVVGLLGLALIVVRVAAERAVARRAPPR